MDAKLKSCTRENTPIWSLDGKKTLARVLDIYDGDSVTLAIPLSEDEVYSFSARLSGLDTCELRSKTEFCRQKAYEARNRLAQLCGVSDLDLASRCSRKIMREKLSACDAIVAIECYAFDKYGRILVTLRSAEGAETTFTDILIAERLGYVYDGKTKPTEDEIRNILAPAGPVE
jgi:endonuclease YncB( thermonuclease family)